MSSLDKFRMAFLSPPPQVTRRSRNTFPVTCSHRDCRKPSTLPPLFSAMVAATISLPLVSGEQGGTQPLYRKLAPAAATAAVATSLLLRRRQKSSRTVLPKQSPGTGNFEAVAHELQGVVQNRSRTDSTIYDGSRQDWSISETQFEERSPSDTQHSAGSSIPDSKGSYTSSETYSGTLRELYNKNATGERRAVGMDTSSLFSHMRAEFLSDPSKEQEDMRPQGNSSFHDQEERQENQVRPLTSDQSGKGGGSQLPKLQHPSSVSAADVLRWFVRAPVFILSDIIVPIAQVSSIMWYDCKQWILGKRNEEEKMYFIDDIQPTVNDLNSFEIDSKASLGWDYLDGELTDEEKLVKDVQDNMRTVFGQAYSTVRRFFR